MILADGSRTILYTATRWHPTWWQQRWRDVTQPCTEVSQYVNHGLNEASNQCLGSSLITAMTWHTTALHWAQPMRLPQINSERLPISHGVAWSSLYMRVCLQLRLVRHPFVHEIASPLPEQHSTRPLRLITIWSTTRRSAIIVSPNLLRMKGLFRIVYHSPPAVPWRWNCIAVYEAAYTEPYVRESTRASARIRLGERGWQENHPS